MASRRHQYDLAVDAIDVPNFLHQCVPVRLAMAQGLHVIRLERVVESLQSGVEAAEFISNTHLEQFDLFDSYESDVGTECTGSVYSDSLGTASRLSSSWGTSNNRSDSTCNTLISEFNQHGDCPSCDHHDDDDCSRSFCDTFFDPALTDCTPTERYLAIDDTPFDSRGFQHTEQSDIDAVRRLLTAAIDFIPSIEQAAWDFTIACPSKSSPGPTPSYYHTVSDTDRDHPFRPQAADDGISAVCALTSLARNCFIEPAYHDYIEEKEIDTLVQDCIDTLAISCPTETAEMNTALHLGIKLNLLDSIGQSLGLASSLSLLFCFQLLDISRLDYTTLCHLRHVLAEDHLALNEIRTFADFTDSWWLRCRRDYEAHAAELPMSSHHR